MDELAPRYPRADGARVLTAYFDPGDARGAPMASRPHAVIAVAEVRPRAPVDGSRARIRRGRRDAVPGRLRFDDIVERHRLGRLQWLLAGEDGGN